MKQLTRAEERTLQNPKGLSAALLRAQAIFLNEHPDVWATHTETERKYTIKQLAKKLVKKYSRDGEYTVAQAREKVKAYFKDFPRTEKDLKRWEENKPKRDEAALQDRDEPRRQGKPRPRQVEDEIGETDPLETSYQGDTKVYSTQGAFSTRGIRDGIVVSDIEEIEEPQAYAGGDLVGDRPPRTLPDLLARWPIATENSQYYFRLVRLKPKKYAGLDIAGFLQDIHGRAFSESELASMYGGGEYTVTLYGPNPRGSRDGEGNIVVKALTEPILVVVPGAPRLTSSQIPGDAMNPMNPFGAVNPVVTPGDAQVHKTSVSFFQDVLKDTQRESQRREQESGRTNLQMLALMADSQKQQTHLLERAAEQRENLLKEQVASLRKEVEGVEKNKIKSVDEVVKAEKAQTTAIIELFKATAPDKEAEIRRISDFYNQRLEAMTRDHNAQMVAMREQHTVQLTSMRDQHNTDTRRNDERLRDVESQYRLMLEQERSSSKTSLEQERTASRQTLDQERSQWAQRESSLREQINTQVSAEREQARQRIEDLKQRHEQEIKTIERSHERELRAVKESFDTKYEVASQTSKLQESQLRERLTDAKEDAERAREEAEEAKDLTVQLEKMEKQASLLGFEKKDADAPKTAMERFAATAGAGLSQVLATANEWLPAALASRQASQPPQPNPRQLAQIQQQQRAMAVQRQAQARQQAAQAQASQAQAQNGAPARRTRGSQWASERVTEQRDVQVPQTPLGFSSDGAQQATWIDTTPAPAGATPSQPPAPTPVAEPTPATSVVAQPQSEPSNGHAQITLPAKFDGIPTEVVVALIQQIERQIDMQVDPSGFAALVVGQYGESAAMLTNFEAKDLTEVVELFGGADTSPIMRRAGRKWTESFWKALRSQLKQRASTLESMQTT